MVGTFSNVGESCSGTGVHGSSVLCVPDVEWIVPKGAFTPFGVYADDTRFLTVRNFTRKLVISGLHAGKNTAALHIERDPEGDQITVVKEVKALESSK